MAVLLLERDGRFRELLAAVVALDGDQRAAMASSINGVMITDRQGRIVWVNHAFTRMSGFTLVEAVGHTPSLTKPGHQTAEYYRELWAAILAGRIWHSEVVEQRKDGSRYLVRQPITPLRDEQGNVTRFVAGAAATSSPRPGPMPWPRPLRRQSILYHCRQHLLS